MKLKLKMIFAAVVIAAFLIFGIPVLINECYKHGGYITMWEAADVLSYYGAILGASIAVGTLAVTILFTRKQIQRESYLNDKKATWSKIDEIFTATLRTISPIPPMKESIERGQIEPSKAVMIFQKYQMSCQTATDELIAYLDHSDYQKVKTLIDQIISVANQFFQISEEEIEIYRKLTSFIGRNLAQQVVAAEAKCPGSFPEEQISFCRELLRDTDSLSHNFFTQKIGQINEKLIAAYENSYRPLLALKRTTFEEIDNEVQKEADSILHLWRK